MAIRRPKPRLDADNERLLKLLDELLASAATPTEGRGNQVASTVVMSDKEAAELAAHFERLLQTRQFIEALYFVDQIYGRPSPVDLDVLRSIFVAGTKRNGRAANIHSTRKWQEFLIRLGAHRPIWPSERLQPMSFDQFLLMEQRLFEYLGLDPKTREILLKVAAKGREHHEHLRQFDFGEIRGERLDRKHDPEESLFRRVREKARSIFSDTIVREASAQQLAGLTTLIANLSVIFTSRDWGAAGTISMMCGAVPLTLIK